MRELADTSAWWASRRNPAIRRDFDARTVYGEIASCDMVRFELLHSTRSAVEFGRRRAKLAALPDCPVDGPTWHRALDVYEHLAGQGGMHHRRVRPADLLIAAAAEAAGVPVLHYDSDYDTIAAITGQPTRWIAPRGSL